MTDLALIAVIAIALAFDFTNGFHDAANSIATVVATRVLTPRLAVVWAAVFNFIAFLIFKTAVASTIAKGVVDQDVLSIGVVFAGLIGAITWNLVTYYLGLPSSSSHALVGGIVGAAVAKSGFSAVVSDGLSKIAVFIVLAPLIGLAMAFIVMVIVLQGSARFHNVDQLNRGFRNTKLQPAGGVAAESAAAATLFFVSAHGIPVSTTHTITGSIVGIGSIQRLSAVRWGVAGRVVWAWILTIPGAAIVAAAVFR